MVVYSRIPPAPTDKSSIRIDDIDRRVVVSLKYSCHISMGVINGHRLVEGVNYTVYRGVTIEANQPTGHKASQEYII